MESKATMSFLDPKLPQHLGISAVGAIFRPKMAWGKTANHIKKFVAFAQPQKFPRSEILDLRERLKFWLEYVDLVSKRNP